MLAAVVLALGAAGCGGGDDEAVTTTDALTGLYVIDHDGVDPTGGALGPYETAFAAIRKECDGPVEELASSIQTLSFEASNGSGTFISNLEALRGVARYLDANPQESGDCGGIFVGVQAYLQGTALD